MKNEKMKSDVEVFICNYKRDNDESCAQKGSKELTDKVKKWVKEKYGKDVKVYRSGCLGKCSEGIAIAMYPEKKFILEVAEDDDSEIKEKIEKAYKELNR